MKNQYDGQSANNKDFSTSISFLFAKTELSQKGQNCQHRRQVNFTAVPQVYANAILSIFGRSGITLSEMIEVLIPRHRVKFRNMISFIR